VWRVCCSYAGRIWDVYDGWANLLPRAASEATRTWDIFKPVKILFWHDEKFKMEDCKDAATPIATNYLMVVDEVGQQVDSTKYRWLIGSLLYLITSRPYIQFCVCLCICLVIRWIWVRILASAILKSSVKGVEMEIVRLEKIKWINI